ncbi:hypothetical protein J6590_087737 [Homalodisca vitripennis]|nr:hypothetical protein J6590_087737 [Homalodisca vitripennis]
MAQCSGLSQAMSSRSCPCKRPACPAISGGSEVTFKPLVPRLSVREGFLALTSPVDIDVNIARLDGGINVNGSSGVAIDFKMVLILLSYRRDGGIDVTITLTSDDSDVP